MTDRLVHWAETAPDRTFIARRERLADGSTGDWRMCHLRARRCSRAQHRPGAAGPRPVGRAAGRHPEREQPRARAAGAGLPVRRHPALPGVAGLFDHQPGLRQAAPRAGDADARPGVRRRRGALRQGHRRHRAGRRRSGAGRRRDRRPQVTRWAATCWTRRHARRRRRDAGHRPGHHHQVPVHLGLDQAAQGGDQHARHVVRQPAADAPVDAGAGRGAAGAGGLAALEPHLRRQPQRRPGLQRRHAATSTTASRRRR
jgi:hypothetical protein